MPLSRATAPIPGLLYARSRRPAELVAACAILCIGSLAVFSPTLSLSAQSERGASRERLVLRLPVDATTLKGAELVRWRAPGGTTVAPATVVSAGVDGSEIRSVDCRVEDIYVVRTPRLVSTPFRPLAPGDCALQDVRLRLFARSGIGGVIHAPDAALAATTMKARECATPVPSGLESQLFDSYPVEFPGDHRWRTALPATCLDLALSVPDFDPVVWKQLELPAGGFISVGDVRLREFGTLTVSVKAGEEMQPVVGAAVSVVAEEGFDATLRNLYQGSSAPALARAVTDARGNATLRVAPGLVHVCIQAAGYGLLCSDTGVIAPGEQSPFPPFILARPGRLSVILEAAPLPNEPPWDDVQFSAVASAFVSGRWELTSFTAKLKPGEEAEFPPLPAGRWSIDLRISGEDVNALLLAQAEATVPPGGRDTVRLDLSEALVSGRVRLRGHPVEGRLTFVQRGGKGLDQFRTASDKDGEFLALLPERGQYELQVEDPRGKRVAVVPVLTVDSPRLDISLPAARVSGLVIDASGAPVPDAAVTLRATAVKDRDVPGSIQHDQRTDRAGMFAIDSVPPGEWKLEARSGRRWSEAVFVGIADSTESRFTLALKDGATVNCRVVAEQGQGLPGVTGVGFIEPIRPQDIAEGDVQFQTGPDGQFSVNVREAAGRVLNVQLFGPLFGGAALRAGLDSPCELRVPTEAGGLRVRLSGAGPGAGGTLALMTDDGALLGISILMVAGAATIGRSGADTIIDIPRLAPGRWHLFRVNAGQFVSRLKFGRPPDYVALGDADVIAGSTTVLRIEW